MTSCGSDESDIVDDTTSPLPESGISRYFYESGPPTNTYIELEFEDPDFISKRYYFGMPDSRFYNLYSYDSEGKLTGADFYNNAGEFESPVYKIEYDGTRLKKVLLFSMGPDDPIEIEVTYSGNEISFLKTDDGRVASMLFDGDRLVATSHEAMPEFFKTTELIYDDSGELIQINNYNNGNPYYQLSFEQSDVANPLYNFHNKNAIAFYAVNIFDIDFDGDYNPYLKNLLIRKTESAAGTDLTSEYNITRDATGLPEKIEVYKDGTLSSTQRFEY